MFITLKLFKNLKEVWKILQNPFKKDVLILNFQLISSLVWNSTMMAISLPLVTRVVG